MGGGEVGSGGGGDGDTSQYRKKNSNCHITWIIKRKGKQLVIY